jgi:LuxR family transcriptional regulator, quorum-sensing system regulator CviR
MNAEPVRNRRHPLSPGSMVASNKPAKPHYLSTPDERLRLMDVIDTLEQVRSSEQLLACASGVMQQIFPHRRLACGIGNISGGRVKPYHILLQDFPSEYIEGLRQPDGTIDSPLMRRWRSAQEPVLVELDNNIVGVALSYLARIKKYGFKNAAVHGLVDIQGAVTSFFCFTDIPERLNNRHAYILKLLVPHLHIALMRSTQQQPVPLNPQETLSARQLDILRWIHKGKTNWEIARILGISDDTVKYHITQIHIRLQVTNRTQAVSKALKLRIIEE